MPEKPRIYGLERDGDRWLIFRVRKYIDEATMKAFFNTVALTTDAVKESEPYFMRDGEVGRVSDTVLAEKMPELHAYLNGTKTP